MRNAVGDVQTVAVLGGSSEIGVAIARRLAGPRAARVVLAGRNVDELKACAQQLEQAGAGEVVTTHFDANDVDSHEDVAGQLFAGGDIDVAVVAAGVLGDQAADEQDSRRAAAVLHTNAVGCASIALAVANRMRAQGHGILVVLSSVAGERVRRANFVYGASKAALDGFAQGLDDSLTGTGIRVLIVRPGFVRTKMTQGRAAAPLSVTADEVAAAVEAAIRSGRAVVWVPWTLRYVMAAVRHLPRAIFRRLPL